LKIDVGSGTRKKVNEELVKLGFRIVRNAKRRTPVDTGRLRSSIHFVDNTGVLYSPGGDVQPLKKPSIKGVIRIGTNVKYAEYVEFGTRNQSAQPFLRPAIDEEISKLQR